MLWPFVGNERAVRALKQAIDAGGAQHAYLFVGPERLGRATLARMLAQAVNCTGDKPPCGECGQCHRIASGIHSDVHTVTIEPDSEGAARKGISVEQMREVQQAVSLNPYEGRSRVVVINPADTMSESAQHAFLKTLEEPPPHVVFVLIASNEDALLETILSRCARIDFSLVPTSDIESALIERGDDPTKAKLLARLSGGRPGWAFDAADEPGALERRREEIDTARSLPAMPLEERLDLAEKMSNAFKADRDPVLRTIEDWQAWWRDVLLIQSGAEEAAANIDMLDEIRADAAARSKADVVRFVTSLGDVRANLAANVQSRIALDALMLDVPRTRDRVTR